MNRLTSVALAGVLAVATVATTLASADAGWRGRGYYGGGCVGCGFAAGAVTGLALGAIATAPYRPYYRPYYYGAPAYYYAPPPRRRATIRATRATPTSIGAWPTTAPTIRQPTPSSATTATRTSASARTERRRPDLN